MWLFGALIGAALAFVVDQSVWFVGALLGGVAGWWLGRSGAQHGREGSARRAPVRPRRSTSHRSPARGVAAAEHRRLDRTPLARQTRRSVAARENDGGVPAQSGRRRGEERRGRGRHEYRPLLAARRSARRWHRARSAEARRRLGAAPSGVRRARQTTVPARLRSRDAKPAAYPIATLAPGYRGGEALEFKAARFGTAAARVPIAVAETTAPRALGSEAALRERIDWKRWTLWASLVLDVLLLGWMAVRLGRQMAKPPHPGPAGQNDETA